MAEDDGFLNRWSRRKLAEKEHGEQPQDEMPPPAAEGSVAEQEEGEAPERHPAEDIDIEALTAESDFKVFLQKGVPAAVKRAGLRKLWTTNPELYGREKLNDDFDLADTKTWGLGPPRASSWQLGRGFQKEEDLPPPPRRHDAPDLREEEPPESEEMVAEAEGEEAAPEAESEEPAAAAEDKTVAEPSGQDDGGAQRPAPAQEGNEDTGKA